MVELLYASTLNGFPLEISVIRDGFRKAIARYEFPFKDGAELEDMGQKARRVWFTCYFWDSEGHETYVVLGDFIDSLTSQELFTFVHPTYGPIEGCVESVSVTQDDRQRTAEVEIEFTENLRGPTQTMQDYPAQNVANDCEEAFAIGIFDSIAAFGAECMNFLGSEANLVASLILNPEVAIAPQFTGISPAAYTFVTAVAQGIASLNATLPAVANATNSALAAMTFTSNLPGLVVQAAAKCCERYVILRQALTGSPTNWSSTISSDIGALAASFTSQTSGTPAAIRANTIALPKIILTQAATAAALELAQIYTTDQQNWMTYEQDQGQNAFDVLGNYVYPDAPTAQLMTTNDLEQTLSDVRTIIQGAIDFIRANDVPPSAVASSIEGAGSSIDALKQAALALQVQVENEMLERETLVAVTINHPLPLHLICLMYGLPYNTAEQLWAVNRGTISNPNAVSGQIYVYRQAGAAGMNSNGG